MVTHRCAPPREHSEWIPWWCPQCGQGWDFGDAGHVPSSSPFATVPGPPVKSKPPPPPSVWREESLLHLRTCRKTGCQLCASMRMTIRDRVVASVRP